MFNRTARRASLITYRNLAYISLLLKTKSYNEAWPIVLGLNFKKTEIGLRTCAEACASDPSVWVDRACELYKTAVDDKQRLTPRDTINHLATLTAAKAWKEAFVFMHKTKSQKHLISVPTSIAKTPRPETRQKDLGVLRLAMIGFDCADRVLDNIDDKKKPRLAAKLDGAREVCERVLNDDGDSGFTVISKKADEEGEKKVLDVEAELMEEDDGEYVSLLPESHQRGNRRHTGGANFNPNTRRNI